MVLCRYAHTKNTQNICWHGKSRRTKFAIAKRESCSHCVCTFFSKASKTSVKTASTISTWPVVPFKALGRKLQTVALANWNIDVMFGCQVTSIDDVAFQCFIFKCLEAESEVTGSRNSINTHRFNASWKTAMQDRCAQRLSYIWRVIWPMFSIWPEIKQRIHVKIFKFLRFQS